MQAVYSALEKLAQSYLDGFYEGDVIKLRSIFLPSANLNQVVENQVSIISCGDWLDRVAGRPSPKATGLNRDEQILSIEVLGPTLAVLKVKCSAKPKYFTDILSCLKIDGKRFIAQKVFMTETR